MALLPNSIYKQNELSKQIYKELKAQHPSLKNIILEASVMIEDTLQKKVWLSNVTLNEKLNASDEEKIKNWLKVRLNTPNLIIHFEK